MINTQEKRKGRRLTRAITTEPGCGTAPWALCPTTSTVDLCEANEPRTVRTPVIDPNPNP